MLNCWEVCVPVLSVTRAVKIYIPVMVDASVATEGLHSTRVETFTELERSLSKVDVPSRNIKRPVIGIIKATGSVGHDEIVFWIGVPRPKGITAFHQVINDKRLGWGERVAAIAALILWYGLIEINSERKCCLGRIVNPDLDRLTL